MANRRPAALVAIVFGITASVAASTAPAAPPERVVGVVDGRPVDGLELVRAVNRRLVLDRDGWLHDFDPRQTDHALQPREGRFQPLDAMELRGRLAREFGKDFSVTATAHFLVVTPVDRGTHWPQTFERLHRAFVTFFSVRGVRVLDGSFPMVAIVMPDEAAMHRYLATLGIRSPGAVGVYDQASNRIVMYDHGSSHGGIAVTIYHEAAHQSAFNTGVHSRVSETPHWIVEGVGCLFQSASMVEGRRDATRRDRCDPGLLSAFEEIYGGQPARIAADLQSLIAEDQLFGQRESTRRAYALSWALTFYLAERRSGQFAELLNTYGQRPPLEVYDPVDRVRDFERITGESIDVLARQLARFFERL